jgi:hypothetical protein
MVAVALPVAHRCEPHRRAQGARPRRLDSTFRSHYAGALSLADVVDPKWIARYAQRSTGEKYLVCPNGLASTTFP